MEKDEGKLHFWGFKCGSMSPREGEGGRVRYQCASAVLSFLLLCFLLPSGWSDGAQRNASV